jgi:hypothetical protein
VNDLKLRCAEVEDRYFDALTSSFCRPQDPAALEFSEPGILRPNDVTSILIKRNQANSGWTTLFDLRASRIATG